MKQELTRAVLSRFQCAILLTEIRTNHIRHHATRPPCSFRFKSVLAELGRKQNITLRIVTQLFRVAVPSLVPIRYNGSSFVVRIPVQHLAKMLQMSDHTVRTVHRIVEDVSTTKWPG